MYRLLIAAVAGLSLWAGAQRPAPVPASSYPGLIFTLRTASGATVFTAGARIQLELDFQSTLPGRYIATIGNVFPGRTDATLHVTPAGGWHDPLADFYRTLGGSGCSCLETVAPLTLKPSLQPIELNAFARFDEPGTYTVVASTYRVSRPLPGKPRLPGKQIFISSSPLRITIKAPPAGWVAAELASAEAQLQSAMVRPNDYDQLQSAEQRLASLGGAAAARDLAGLLTTRFLPRLTTVAEAGAPGAALAVLDDKLHDPHQPLSTDLLNDIVTMRLVARGASRADAAKEAGAVLAETAPWLEQKQGAALAPSLLTVLQYGPAQFPDADRAEFTAALADHFDELPADGRLAALSDLGGPKDPLAGPAELGFVRRVAQMPLAGYFAGGAHASALYRWYQLAPTEARGAVISAIAGATADARHLGFLPDKVLPQTDQALLADITAAPGTGNDDAASLIARYGSPAIAGGLALTLNARGGAWSCEVRRDLVAYLMRVQPALAAPAQALIGRPFTAGGCTAASVTGSAHLQH
ncbi:MAG: hypothetical protein ACRD1M_12605 [Terriglobales bacterium]